MNRSSIHVALLSALPLALIACAVEAPDATGASQDAIQESNGREMNGREMNGREMNGREMNGREMNGVTAGVWYAKRAGATILDPIVMAPTQSGFASKLAAANVTDKIMMPTTGTLSPLTSIALEHGQLVGVRPNGTRVQGAAFKDIYLVGRGPKPVLKVALPGGLGPIGAIGAMSQRVDLGGLPTMTTTGTAATTAATTATTAAGVTPVQSTADKIRAYVAKRLAETNVPERDVSLHVIAAMPNPPVNPFHYNHLASGRWHYRVEVKDDDGVYRSFCGTNADGSKRLAIALPDRFNYSQGLLRTVTTVVRDHRVGAPTTTTSRVERGGELVTDGSAFTFACDNAAVSKCVEHLSYDPEETIDQVTSQPATFAVGKPARDLLQSCVRMFRADFCGNGLSMTLDGTAIDIADSAKINLPSQIPPGDPAKWSLEASWRPDGAACAQKERQVCVPTGDGNLARMKVRDYIDAICPTAVDSVAESDDQMCEASHYTPGLLGGPFGGAGGGATGGVTTGGQHLSLTPTLTPQQINTNGGGGTTGYDEWDVIWTTTSESRDGCYLARNLGDLAATEMATIMR